MDSILIMRLKEILTEEEDMNIKLIEIPPEANLLIRKNMDAGYIINKRQNGEICSNLLEDLNIESYKKPWGKLEHELKINRAMQYVKDEIIRKNLSEDESKKLRVLLVNLINRRMITKKNDVEYDADNGVLTNIANLTFHEIKREYTYTSDENVYVSHVTTLSPEQNKLFQTILKK
jgi:hypothetical protein